MPHGEDARIVREAELTKNIESPEGVLRDGKAGSAVPAHWSPTTVLKQLLRAPCVLSKLIPRHLIHSSMAQTVAGNLVASLGDALDDVWMRWRGMRDRKSTRLNSSHLVISYAVFCLKKKKKI